MNQLVTISRCTPMTCMRVNESNSVMLYKIFPKTLWAFLLYGFCWKPLSWICQDIESRDDCLCNDIVMRDGVIPTELLWINMKWITWNSERCFGKWEVVREVVLDLYIQINNSTIIYIHIVREPTLLDLEDPRLNDTYLCFFIHIANRHNSTIMFRILRKYSYS